MLKSLCILCLCWFSVSSAWADVSSAENGVRAYVKNGVVYCDTQAFQQEAYILKVIGSGSPMTVFWQFDVEQVRDYWLNKQVVSVRLGRQVIPDLVTQRWLMRDLNVGIVKHTTDAQEAMRFLSEMNQAAVVDVTVLDADTNYLLKTRFFLYEGEAEEKSWIPLLNSSGVDMGDLALDLGLDAVND